MVRVNDITLLAHQKWIWLLVPVLLLTVVSGIRFSDGSMLLAISNGSTIADPIFANPSTQYVWDSPLKIWILRLLPPSILLIALAFALIAIAPLSAFLLRNALLVWLTLVALFLTPVFKVSIQNMGVGDGFTILAIVLAVWARSYLLVSVIFFLIALWHPQQSFFIGISFLVGRYLYSPRVDLKEFTAVLAALSAAAIVFFSWKLSLGFDYAGREAYMAQNLSCFFQRDPAAYLIAFLPVAFWFMLVAPRPSRAIGLLPAWLALLAAVSVLTTDVTRVMTLISLPIVLSGAKQIFESKREISSGLLLGCCALTFILPVYSWSGYDALLWSDLFRDFCKWGVYCQ